MRIVEDSGVGSAGSECWCTLRVSYGVDGCNLIATEHGRYDLS